MKVHSKQRLRDDKSEALAWNKEYKWQIKMLRQALEEITTKKNPAVMRKIAENALK